MNTRESQWLAQLAAMRQAIAELKLDQQDSEVQGYGHDIVVDDEDTERSSDDIWDISSQGKDDEYSSDTTNNLEDIQHELDYQKLDYGLEWLKTQCVAFAGRKSGTEAKQLQDQLSALLASDMKGMASAYFPHC